MKLSEIPEVILTTRDYKYLLLEIFSLKEGVGKLIIRGCRRPRYHNGIFLEERRKYNVDEFHISVLGGGSVVIDENREITIGEKSQEYGREPDRNVTVEILRRHFPVVNLS